jgi:ankyrin repeat protein
MKTVTDVMKRDFVTDCWNGMMDRIKETLAAFPEAVHWKNQWGKTGLHNAIAHGTHKMDVAKLLVDNGADINVPDSDGWTPLMHAAEAGMGPDRDKRVSEYVTWLLALGADATRVNHKGETAAQITAAKENTATLTILRCREDEQNRAAADSLRAEEADRNAPHSGISKALAVRRPLQLKR